MKNFAKVPSFNGHLSGKKHKKSAERLSSLEEKTFELQFKLNKLGEQIEEQLEATKIHVETKLARRYEDLEGEDSDEEVIELSESDSEEEAEEATRRCITNYPVGWDGKPIPYWLYKLHGLGIEFKCEICGNNSYWGRRAYERHFQEYRHSYGMKCLGIPNTKAFNEVTNINDALACRSFYGCEWGDHILTWEWLARLQCGRRSGRRRALIGMLMRKSMKTLMATS
jgi:splicing factor 3A subunit 3